MARRLVAIREEHGGRSLAFYGGGGQGNHLGGVFAVPLTKAMGTRYHYSSLAQGEDGGLLGQRSALRPPDLSHHRRPGAGRRRGLHRHEPLAGPRDPECPGHGQGSGRRSGPNHDRDRPRRTETAARADIHLQLRPGTDAWLLSAILAVVVQEGLVDRDFLERRTVGFEEVERVLAAVPADDFAARAGVPAPQVREVARRIAGANAACIRVDLGIQQTLHSTLNSYLEKLLYLLTGNFGKPGTNNFHSFLLPLIGHSDPPGKGSASWTTAATGLPEISKLFPPNVLPAEIDNEREDRIRGLVVDSANPMRSGADTAAYSRAFGEAGAARRDRRRDVGDGAARPLRPSGRHPAREVGGDLLQSGVSDQRLPPARAGASGAGGAADRAGDLPPPAGGDGGAPPALSVPGAGARWHRRFPGWGFSAWR